MPSTARLYVPLLFLSNERKAAVSITVQEDGNRKCRKLSVSHKTGISHVFVLIQSLTSNWYRNTLLKQFTHFHKWSADMGSTPTRFIVFLHLHFITFVWYDKLYFITERNLNRSVFTSKRKVLAHQVFRTVFKVIHMTYRITHSLCFVICNNLLLV